MFASGSNSIKACAHCYSTDPPPRACAGVCGGSVAYCNRECQIAHRPRHNQVCWKKANTDTFTIPNPKNEGQLIPLRAFHKMDGFNRSGLLLNYSDHLGEELTRHYVIEYFGEVDDENGWNAKGLSTVGWAVVTSPVHDDTDRASLKPGEAVFNVTKHEVEVKSLIDAGIIKDTGRRIKIGYYSPHPVCRLNIPVHHDNVE